MADDREPLYEEEVDRIVGETFDRLVEAWEDLEEAERALEGYKSSKSEPPASSSFEGREQFTDFVWRKMDYDRGLEWVTGKLEAAKKQYDEAAKQAAALLPEKSSLTYDYSGARGSLRGTRYVVRNQPRVSSYGYDDRTNRAGVSVEVLHRPHQPQSPS